MVHMCVCTYMCTRFEGKTYLRTHMYVYTIDGMVIHTKSTSASISHNMIILNLTQPYSTSYCMKKLQKNYLDTRYTKFQNQERPNL
jgi:hypothetical protein